ncbi:MAG: thiamine pyrophosphate-dependent enzyme, partial [Pseudomonadota bacterium]
LRETCYDVDRLNVGPVGRRDVNRDQVHAAIELITAAERPLIVVGGGALDHADPIRALARTIGAGVISFRTGHGIMPASDPLALSNPAGHALWRDCDLVVCLGTRLVTQKHGWGLDADIKLIHIDIDEGVLGVVQEPTVGLCADLKDALPMVLASLPEQPDRATWRSQIAQAKAATADYIADQLAPQLSWLKAIRDALPPDGLLFDELTQIGFVSRFAFPVEAPRTFLSTGYQGTLGWGVAAAIGAAHARRDVPVVSIAGDGGALFTITELATAVHHKIPVNLVVLNDNAYGNVKGIQRDQYQGRYIASDLTSPDFVALAHSFGAHGVRAHTPDELSAALSKAVASDGVHVIEVPVGEFPSPWQHIMLPRVRGPKT